jgi:hypothetical protein
MTITRGDVAHIIDPEAFASDVERFPDWARNHRWRCEERRKAALEKADAIIALSAGERQ